jgi:O-antigen ligase
VPIRHSIIPLYLLLCLLLGGASLGGYLANMALQLLAVVLIVLALSTVRRTPMARSARVLLILLAMMIGLVLLQLVPLPPGIWTALPGREAVAQGYALLEVPLPWLPISLAPEQTVASLLWLLPAIAVLLGIMRLGYYRPEWIAGAVIAGTLAGVLVGALQIGSATSPFYFYHVTNRGAAVGFFANANHMATLLVGSIPFLAALYARSRSRSSSQRASARRRSGGTVAAAAMLGVVAVGIGLNRSLAGIGLAVPALGASFLLIRMRKKRPPALSMIVVAALAAAAVAVVALAPFGNNLTTQEARTSPISRYTSISTTLSAGTDFLPLGSGLGTFARIYQGRENPDAVERTWMNHAHSDYAEIYLEFGVPGLLLVGLFLMWWVGRAIAAWGADGDIFARAATIASATILVHSLVDYPLRTAALSALFAACCALMAESRPRSAARARETVSDARHLSA